MCGLEGKQLGRLQNAQWLRLLSPSKESTITGTITHLVLPCFLELLIVSGDMAQFLASSQKQLILLLLVASFVSCLSLAQADLVSTVEKLIGRKGKGFESQRLFKTCRIPDAKFTKPGALQGVQKSPRPHELMFVKDLPNSFFWGVRDLFLDCIYQLMMSLKFELFTETMNAILQESS